MNLILVLVAFFATLTVALSTPDCPSVHLVLARASTEPVGAGMIGTVAAIVQTRVSSTDVESLEYPALLDPYISSQTQGVAALTQLVRNYAEMCLETKMVLMGYSQVINTDLKLKQTTNANEYDREPMSLPMFCVVRVKSASHLPCHKTRRSQARVSFSNDLKFSVLTTIVAAVVLMGDPSHVAHQPFDAGSSAHDGVSNPSRLINDPANMLEDLSSSESSRLCCHRGQNNLILRPLRHLL